ncbi:MAG: DUF3343 domain-containing protein [Nitrospinota bacterium]|nr:DUF3343 domain-containing protein [Nitrospinota bacterium]
MSHPIVYAVFQNTHSTLRAEKILKEGGLVVRTAMKPSGIGAGCQMALTLPQVSATLAAALCREGGMRAPLFFAKGGDGAWEEISSDEDQ